MACPHGYRPSPKSSPPSTSRPTPPHSKKQLSSRSASRHQTASGQSTPDTPADTAGCRAVNHQLANVVQRHFPGAVLVDEINEPAVIDSTWQHPATGATFAIEWDHTRKLGDPSGLTVREIDQ